MDEEKQEYRFDAFISYRRQDGSALAAWLRHRLQDYVLPLPIRGNRGKLKIYLDTIFERANEDFWDHNIVPELEASRYLIIISSPSILSARPDGQENWVIREIKHFLTLPQKNNILFVKGPGAPEAPPSILLERFPQLNIVDLEAFSPRIDRLFFRFPLRQHVVTLLGTLHNFETEQMADLREEAARRARMRATLVFLFVAGLFAVVSALAITAFVQRNNARAAADKERVARREADTNAAEARAQALRANTNADEAQLQTKKAVASAADANHQKFIAQTNEVIANRNARESRARELIADSGESISDDPERALLLASEALNTRLRSNDPPLPEAEDAVHRALLAANLRLILRGHTGNVTGVAFSPDSKRLATVSDDDTVKLWDTVTGRQLSSFSAHSGGLRAVVFMFDNLRLITAGKDGTTRIWNISNAQPTLTLRGHSGPVNAIALNASETLLATAGDDKTARLWDPVTGRELFTLSGHTNSIHGIAFSHNGKRVATSAYDATAKVWDTATGKQLFNLPDHTDSHGAIAFSPNDRTLATPGRGATITLWNADTGEEYKTLSDNSDVIESLAYGRDGNLAAGSADGSVRIWHGEDIRPIAIMRGRSDGVLAVAFSPNGELAATGDTDSLAKIWADPNPEESGTPRSHIHSAVNGLFSPGDQCLAMVRPEKASPNNPQITRIFDISTGAMLQTLKSRTGYMRPLAFSPDCKQIAFDESRYTVSFYDISTGRIVSKLLGYASTPTALAFSPDGKRAVLASTDNTITAWDTATGKRQLFIAADAGVVSEIKYSADGKQIAVAGQTVKLWDTATGRLLHSLPRPRNSLHIEFSPDDRMFATSAGAGSATKVWDIEQGRETVTLNAFDHATFSPDGSRLAGTAADDIKIANASTGQILSTLRGHPLTNRLAFSLDGKRLLTYGSDGLRVFYLDPHDLVDLARSRITRDPPTFTEDECRRFFQKKPCPTRERAADDFRTPRP